MQSDSLRKGSKVAVGTKKYQMRYFEIEFLVQ